MSVKKRYTIKFFDDTGLKDVIGFHLSSTSIMFIIIVLVLLLCSFVYNIYTLFSRNVYKEQIIAVNNENVKLKNYIEEYDRRYSVINDKLEDVKKLEFQVKDLISQDEMASGNSTFVDKFQVQLLKDYSSSVDTVTDQFLNSLGDKLDNLTVQLFGRERELDELLNSVISNKHVLDSTPTVRPVIGRISSPFGYRSDPVYQRPEVHEGVDLAAAYGTPIHAAASGVVIFAGVITGYGNLVSIDHGYGYITRYGHMSKISVKVGDHVKKGDSVGNIGMTGKTTGPHVHYEVLINEAPSNPVRFLLVDPPKTVGTIDVH